MTKNQTLYTDMLLDWTDHLTYNFISHFLESNKQITLSINTDIPFTVNKIPVDNPH